MRVPKIPRKTLIEVFSHVDEDDGIFRYMASPPWSEWTLSTDTLDVVYFWSRSGDKLISPFIARLLDSDGELSVTKMRSIASIISELYYPIWAKLFATYDVEYNPIYNFSITKSVMETHNDSDSASHSKGTSESRTLNTSDARTLNTSDARTIDRDVGEQADRSAYNASTYSPVDKVTTAEDTTDTLRRTGTDTLLKTGTDTLRYTGTDTDSMTNMGGYTISETRSGFNGNYMYQAALESDRKLWMASYFEKIFADVDELLTLPIYAADPHYRGYAVSRGYPYI